MRIVCLSDTHSFNARIGTLQENDPEPVGVIPDGDILIHAGDLTDSGKPNEIFDAYAWLSNMPHQRIVVTPGNHDFGFQKIPELRRVLDAKFPRITGNTASSPSASSISSAASG
jgi:predicted phosphodiesterase